MNKWIGVDLDGTLAYYESYHVNAKTIGEPIPLMLNRVKSWLADNKKVKIFTARVAGGGLEQDVQRSLVEEWSEKHIGQKLEVTCVKDWQMVELWDDRAIQVKKNTGEKI